MLPERAAPLCPVAAKCLFSTAAFPAAPGPPIWTLIECCAVAHPVGFHRGVVRFLYKSLKKTLAGMRVVFESKLRFPVYLFIRSVRTTIKRSTVIGCTSGKLTQWRPIRCGWSDLKSSGVVTGFMDLTGSRFMFILLATFAGFSGGLVHKSVGLYSNTS